MSQESQNSQLRKGLLEYCVLLIIDKEEIYSSHILDMLTQSKMIVAEGTLYPILTRLKNSGMVSYRWIESNQGPPRKYFTITESGKQFLAELEKQWQDLINIINSLKEKK